MMTTEILSRINIYLTNISPLEHDKHPKFMN